MSFLRRPGNARSAALPGLQGETVTEPEVCGLRLRYDREHQVMRVEVVAGEMMITLPVPVDRFFALLAESIK